MRVDIISFTDRGEMLAGKLADELGGTAFRGGRDGSVHEWAAKAFANSDALIYVGAVGICVRTIAPYIRSKVTDPAVVVIDETAKYVIPILSGHLGGANDLARKLARFIGAEAVITTATDRNNVFSVDAWAGIQGCAVENPERIKSVSSKILAGREIVILSDYPIEGEVPENVKVRLRKVSPRQDLRNPAEYAPFESANENQPDYETDVILTIDRNDDMGDAGDKLRLVPRIICAGIGCRRGISEQAVTEAVVNACREAGVSELSLYRVASIDLKKDEEGLREFCRKRKLEFVTFSAEQLAAVPGSYVSSEFVREVTGVDNVCERSAVCGAYTVSSMPGKLIFRKHMYGGVTVALAERAFAPDFRSQV